MTLPTKAATLVRPMRKLWLVTFGIVIALVAAEFCLQIGAWILWNQRTLPDAAAQGDGGVLCVGDSFTYGLGARDREADAYPHVLEDLLQADGSKTTRVINAGWPGQDSRAVLAQLEGQLATYSPRIVYALVGYNDFWKSTSEGTPAELASAEDGFPWRFRLGSLASLAYHALAGTAEEVAHDTEEAAADPKQSAGEASRPPHDAVFVGPWHAGPMWFEFCADGALDSSGGRLPTRWTWRDGYIILHDLVSGERSEIAFETPDDDHLVLTGGPFPVATTLEKGLPRTDAFDRGYRAVREGRAEDAERELRAALTTPRAQEARATLVAWHAREGRVPAAETLLKPWQESWQKAPTPAIGTQLVRAYLALGNTPEAMRIAGTYLATLPFDDKIAQHVIHEGGKLDDKQELVATLDRAVERENISPFERAAIYGLLRSLVPEDVTRRATVMAATLLVDPASTAVERTLAWDAKSYPRDEVLAAIERLGADDKGPRETAIAAFDTMSAGSDHTSSGLAAGLLKILQTCREAGAEVVFLTYPTSRPSIRSTVLGVGQDHGVPVIDIFGEFETRLPDPAVRDAHFVLDGHCNGRGYRLMAGIVAEDARVRLSR